MASGYPERRAAMETLGGSSIARWLRPDGLRARMHSRAAASIAATYANRSEIRSPNIQMPARIGRRRRTGRRQCPPGTVTSSNASQHDHPKPSGNMHSDWLPYSVAGAAAIFIAVGLWLVGLWGDGRSDYRGPDHYHSCDYDTANTRPTCASCFAGICRSGAAISQLRSTWPTVLLKQPAAATHKEFSVSLKLVLSMDGVEYR